MLPNNLLNDCDIKALKPKSTSYKKSVGKSLFILVNENGSKYWRFKYYLNGIHKALAFGVFPEVTLAKAIKLRDEAKKLLKRGIDPGEIRKEAKSIKKEMKQVPVFRMNISEAGELIIQNDTSSIKLNKSQTEALKFFLNSTP